MDVHILVYVLAGLLKLVQELHLSPAMRAGIAVKKIDVNCLSTNKRDCQ